MATPDSLADVVKTAITSGNATSSTLTTLQTLLGAAPKPESQPEPATRTARPAPTTSSKSKPTRPVKPAGKGSKKDAPVKVLEDEPRSLPPKARYALATAVVNISLKVLSDALKLGYQSQRRTSSSRTNAPDTTPRRLPGTPSVAERALQLRSGNATPSKASPARSKGPKRSPSQSPIHSNLPSAVDWTVTGECARLAFSHLRSVDTEKLGVKCMPAGQLETGMLALAGRLINLGYDSLAAKELHATKKRLLSLQPPTAAKKPSKAPSQSKAAEKETLAGLLNLDLTCEDQPHLRTLAITYHSSVLQLIATSRKPAIIEESLQYLQTDRPGSPINTIVESAHVTGDKAKAARQLETLCHTILRACPSVSSASDEAAKDPAQHPSPLIVCKLQLLALETRQVVWQLANHQIDFEKDVAEPFVKTLSTLARRMAMNNTNARDAFNICKKAYSELGLAREASSLPGHSMFTIDRTLSALAERAGLNNEALSHGVQALKHCSALESNHARLVAALTRKSSALLGARTGSGSDDFSADLDTILHSLKQSLSGSASDYEVLLTELSHLVFNVEQTQYKEIEFNVNAIARAAGAFASRFAKSLPGKQSRVVTDLIAFALHHSKTNEHLTSWVNKDTVSALIHSGAARIVADKAASQPMVQAWSSTTPVLALSRAVKGLVLRAMAADPDKVNNMVFDDENLHVHDRGAILEWQLKCALDFAHKSKYRLALTKLLPELVKVLAREYPAAMYPIRRARVAALLMRAREEFADLLPPHTLHLFKNAENFTEDDLGEDQGLKSYTADIKASITLSRFLYEGRPTLDDLRPSLLSWQKLVEHADDAHALEQVVDCPSILLGQLGSLEDYFCTLGSDHGRLVVVRMMSQIELLWGADGSRWCSSLMRSARAYLSLGYAEKAGELLGNAHEAVKAHDSPQLETLEYNIYHAEYLLAMNKPDECDTALQEAVQTRLNLPPNHIHSHQRKKYKLLHGRGWLVQSQYLQACGRPKEALRAAKRAVKVMNTIWTGIERCNHNSPISLVDDQMESEERPGRPIDTLTRGVSKLNLKDPTKSSPSSSVGSEPKGPAFWPVVRLMCEALVHLSDLFVHHGVFNEANFASERAVNIAEAVASQELLSHVRSRRAVLLATAGKVEEAELCLSHEQEGEHTLSPLIMIELLRAKAFMSLKHGDIKDAYKLLDKAEIIIKTIQAESYLSDVEQFSDGRKPTGTQTKVVVQTTKSQPRSTASSKRPAPAKGILKNKAGGTASPAGSSHGPAYILRKLEAKLASQKAIIAIQIGRGDLSDQLNASSLCASLPDSFNHRHLEHLLAMRKAATVLQSDFSYNSLSESTISFPALRGFPEISLVNSSGQAPAKKPTKKGVKIAKSAQKDIPTVEPLYQLLIAARDCLSLGASSGMMLATAEAHKLHSMLLNASLILSATSMGQVANVLHPVREALSVDLPRMHASQHQKAVARLEVDLQQISDLLVWPIQEEAECRTSLSVKAFQEQYIDILPKPWTAVSLSLNDACDEIFISRYRRGQSPLILRLPFSRQKSEDADEELFDFDVGKAELKEIIELSNYSCHNSLDVSVKGAKTNWWSEREALDRRLQELLTNMENIWLGGFKGVFSQQQRDVDQLDVFRSAFEAILDRHLPSRRGTKKDSKKLSLDDQVLELFIGLGHDQDGEADLDEPLSDLLYFAVDMLQFNGERNAYDEIDFDSMAIEVLDALRAYYDAVDEPNEAAHLILVLDRRLQAFPWENLPCLEMSNVSRVDSMLTLRDRVVEMQKFKQSDPLNGHHEVPRQTGSYILNPSGDLKSTECTLAPELSRLAGAEGRTWTSVVGKVPSEDEFKTALTNSSTLLYFGHGAGSQYIRPRIIRRLEKCSEVVWLMGCSSGAVTEYDELEPHAVPLAYMVAGNNASEEIEEPKNSSKCMAVLATLWDVTDKDIDRFSLAVGQQWGLWQVPQEATRLPVKTPRKRTLAIPTTPEKAPKTPKTPKVKKTPAAARTPARSRSRARSEVGKKQSLAESVSKSRDACYLRYLNGAAPVLFGVPVYLGD